MGEHRFVFDEGAEDWACETCGVPETAHLQGFSSPECHVRNPFLCDECMASAPDRYELGGRIRLLCRTCKSKDRANSGEPPVILQDEELGDARFFEEVI